MYLAHLNTQVGLSVCWLMEDKGVFKKPVIIAIPFGDANGTEITRFRFKFQHDTLTKP